MLNPATHDIATSPAGLGATWHAVWHGLWTGVTSSPWAVAAFAGFLLLVLVRVVHAVAHPKGRRDSMRDFGRADKAEILRRAGGRCEAHGWITARCDATEGL